MKDTLIKTYCKIDNRVRQLGVLLRKWARVCKRLLDNDLQIFEKILLILITAFQILIIDMRNR